MKKKPFALLLALCTLFAALAAFSACGGSDSATGGENNLTYDKKYIASSQVNQEADRQSYFIFHSDKTGEFHCYFNVDFAENSCQAYTIRFTYITKDNESVTCFYDSVEYEEAHTDSSKVSSTWTSTYLYYPEFIRSPYSNSHYICETYLQKLPDFGK